ncbi:MAG TPA: cell division protein FtsZ, partial [Kiloniellales bacterium]
AQAGDLRGPAGGPNADPAPAARPLPAAQPAARAEPTVTAPTPRPAARPSGPSEPKSGTQTRLSGLDPAERSKSGPRDEDLLEIPAFLRRQAN